MSYVAYDAWILKNNSIFMKLMHDVYNVEFLSRISIWNPKYIFSWSINISLKKYKGRLCKKIAFYYTICYAIIGLVNIFK